ncbi:tail fiber protein, partial [Vibrio parahaemolyticus]|nr:tail fiber protein [Vibrio parahaemolyticus]
MGLSQVNTKAENAQNTADNKWTAQNATTAQKGIVQLSDVVTSTSTTLAATANAAKKAYDKAANAQETADEKYDKTGGRITGVVEQYIDGIGTRMASSSTTKAGYLQAGNYDTSQPQKMAISGISGVQLSELNIHMKGTAAPKLNGRDIFVEMPLDSETNPYDVYNAASFTYSSKGHAPFTGSFLSFGYGKYQIKIGGGYTEGAPLWFNTVNGDLEGNSQNEWRQIYDSLNPPPNTAPVRVIILSPEVITSMGSYTFPDGITWYDIVELGVTWTGTTGTTKQTNVYDTHVWNGVSLNSSTTDFAGYLPVASTGLNFGTVAKTSGNGFTLSTTSASGKVQGMYAYITAEAAARLATRNMHIDKAGNILD